MPTTDVGSKTLTTRSLVLLGAALMAAACGGQSKPTTQAHSQTTADAPPRTATTTPASRLGDCNALGINPIGMREGTCTHGGITYVIVDEDHTLKLPTLWGSLSGIHTAKTLTNDAAVATAQGQFLIATLGINNKLATPQTFDPGHTQQAGLILDGAVYKEDPEAENADSDSCLRQNGPIQPGGTVTCDVIFDLPASAAADLGKRGSGDLYLVNFGSDLSGSTLPQMVGQIRLYP
jgi:hypothetical protein